MNLNDRIGKLIEHYQFTSAEFADEIDVQRSSISHVTSGRNKPSLDFLIKIKKRFPELDWEWLIEGEGEMIPAQKEEIVEKPVPQKPTSLPDLFSLIDDDNFGFTESEDKIQKEIPRESLKSETNPVKEILNDSQRLDDKEIYSEPQSAENQHSKIKRVVLFFENGKFESYEL